MNTKNQLLEDLGLKLLMLELQDSLDLDLRHACLQAQADFEDRKSEMDFLLSEIAAHSGKDPEQKKMIKQEMEARKLTIETTKRKLTAFEKQLAPHTTKLARAQYDLQCAEKEMEDAMQKQQKAEAKGKQRRAQSHGDFVKRTRIHIMKRKRNIEEIKLEMLDVSSPLEDCRKKLEQNQQALKELQDARSGKSSSSPESEEMLRHLMQQKEHLDHDLEASQQKLSQLLMRAGRDVFEKRIYHPVLEKYYIELDNLER